MNSLSFARPSFLYLALLLFLLALLAYRAGRWRRMALDRLGRPESLGQNIAPINRRRSRLLLFASLISLAVGIAGPRWGKGGEGGILVGRDLMIVLDFSKSMTAADMADSTYRERWQAARAGIHDLVAELQHHGGHRVGLVVYAAHPWTVCPLTSDYDHFLNRLDEYTPLAPPSEVAALPGENITTGTDVGSALLLALAAHDTHSQGYQDILLLSDGDGPDFEQEADRGIKLAVEKRVPLHVVGLGDPNNPTDLVLGEGENAEFIGTKLQEGNLKEIARRSRGEYLASRREVPRLGEWFEQSLASRPSRELPEEVLPQPKDRAILFVLAGLLFLVVAWMVEK
jgi:Ca-activated chloride channel family protein